METREVDAPTSTVCRRPRSERFSSPVTVARQSLEEEDPLVDDDVAVEDELVLDVEAGVLDELDDSEPPEADDDDPPRLSVL